MEGYEEAGSIGKKFPARAYRGKHGEALTLMKCRPISQHGAGAGGAEVPREIGVGTQASIRRLSSEHIKTRCCQCEFRLTGHLCVTSGDRDAVDTAVTDLGDFGSRRRVI